MLETAEESIDAPDTLCAPSGGSYKPHRFRSPYLRRQRSMGGDHLLQPVPKPSVRFLRGIFRRSVGFFDSPCPRLGGSCPRLYPRNRDCSVGPGNDAVLLAKRVAQLS